MTGSKATGRAMSGGFAKDEGWDFEIRCALGEARSGATDPGELLSAIDGIRKGDAVGWKRAWAELGHRVAAEGTASLTAGRRVSAASGFLRGASYLARAVNAAAAEADDPDLLPLFRAHRAAWESFLDAGDLGVVRLEVPLDAFSMPVWFFPAPSGGTAPTIIGVNGSDGALTDMWSSIVHPARERGYHALLFDGPGQQSLLFEHGVPFRADWGPVLTAVVDALLQRADVDPSRIAAYGVSQGGYWLPQALATEHRLAAAIADPGVVEVAASWTSHLPGNLMRLFHDGKREAFDRDMEFAMKLSPDTARIWRFRARPFLAGSPSATLAAVSEYVSRDVLPGVTTPLFVADPEGEQFWPGQSAEMASLVPGATLVPFTAAEGADGHCEPLGRAVFEQRAFDWLDGKLG